jgi:hypothetical protein
MYVLPGEMSYSWPGTALWFTVRCARPFEASRCCQKETTITTTIIITITKPTVAKTKTKTETNGKQSDENSNTNSADIKK